MLFNYKKNVRRQIISIIRIQFYPFLHKWRSFITPFVQSLWSHLANIWPQKLSFILKPKNWLSFIQMVHFFQANFFKENCSEFNFFKGKFLKILSIFKYIIFKKAFLQKALFYRRHFFQEVLFFSRSTFSEGTFLLIYGHKCLTLHKGKILFQKSIFLITTFLKSYLFQKVLFQKAYFSKEDLFKRYFFQNVLLSIRTFFKN